MILQLLSLKISLLKCIIGKISVSNMDHSKSKFFVIASWSFTRMGFIIGDWQILIRQKYFCYFKTSLRKFLDRFDNFVIVIVKMHSTFCLFGNRLPLKNLLHNFFFAKHSWQYWGKFIYNSHLNCKILLMFQLASGF